MSDIVSAYYDWLEEQEYIKNKYKICPDCGIQHEEKTEKCYDCYYSSCII